MSKLSLKLNGQILKVIEVEEGREYFAGRANDCDFPLDDHRGISRQHLKFFFQNGMWYCESLSKFLHPKMGSENFETLEINETVTFTLFPYEFEFYIERTEAPMTPPEPEYNEEQHVPAERALVPTARVEHQPIFEPETGQINMEATMVGAMQVTPILRIIYPSTSDNETLKLEGQVWTAGREADAEIQLHDSKISRKHFEINKNEQGYFVTDLGSSNGTYLNGNKLPPHEPTRLTSGDILRALQIEVHFELKASNLPALTAQPLALSPHISMPNNGQWMVPGQWDHQAQLPQTSYYPPEEEFTNTSKKFDLKKNKIRIALGGVLLLVFGFLFMEPDKTKDSKNAAATGNTTPAFENLSPEQRSAVKDSLGLARNLYVQGKYSLCLAEIARLHEVVPFYDNSKELESFCIQGHELTQRKIDNDRKEAEKAMVEQKIADVTSGCKEKFNDSGEVSEIRACLAEAIELNPDHPVIVELIQRAEDRIRDKKLAIQQKEAERIRINSTLSILSNAKKLRADGKLAKAKAEYNRFIANSHSSLSSQKNEAQRELASVSSQLATKVNLAMEKCKAFGEAGKFKDAYEACEEALKEDPSVASAKELQEKHMNQLRRLMKVLYEDAKLEESLGNVDTAKEKWKKIREETPAFDDYYKKSTLKLREYGAI